MFIDSINVSDIAETLSKNSENRTVLLFVAENTKISITSLIEELCKVKIDFIGGVFPKIVADNSVKDEGIVANFLSNEVSVFVAHNLEEKEYTIPTVELKKNCDYSAFTIVDGLAGNISHYLSELYRNIGNYCTHMGGGAGSLTLEQKPCVFDNNGFYQNTAITLISENKINIGVKHGWEKIEGPIIATKTDKNIIQEINWRNAFEVYKLIVEQDSNKQIRDDNFFEIAKGYPFGIVKENSECVVRDPIATNEKGELICVGEVLENTVLDILKGKDENLISSANQAAIISSENVENPKTAIIIDCISRVLFLEDNFQKELDSVTKVLEKKNPDIMISGALTLGEISSYHGYLEFFNKTIVVGLMS